MIKFSLSPIHTLDKDLLLAIKNKHIEKNLYSWFFEPPFDYRFDRYLAQGYLKGLAPALQKPNKQFDSNYSGQYDYCLLDEENLIKIEVKASRAVDFEVDAPL